MYEQLKQILVEELNIDEKRITPDSELVGDLEINSIDLADLVMKFEEMYEIEIPEDQLVKFVTAGDVANYLEEVVK